MEQRTALFKSLVAKAIKADARAAALVVRLMEQLEVDKVAAAHQPVTHIIRTIIDPRQVERLEPKQIRTIIDPRQVERLEPKQTGDRQ